MGVEHGVRWMDETDDLKADKRASKSDFDSGKSTLPISWSRRGGGCNGESEAGGEDEDV